MTKQEQIDQIVNQIIELKDQKRKLEQEIANEFAPKIPKQFKNQYIMYKNNKSITVMTVDAIVSVRDEDPEFRELIFCGRGCVKYITGSIRFMNETTIHFAPEGYKETSLRGNFNDIEIISKEKYDNFCKSAYETLMNTPKNWDNYYN